MSVDGTIYSGGEKVSETKTYHFLAGLQRSGNTVLSSILNQNPDIYSSPLSPVCQYMWNIHTEKNMSDHVTRQNDFTGSNQVISNILPSHYSHIAKPVIFDREKHWGSSANLSMLKMYVNPNPKIIFTVRPVLEILASSLQIYLKTSRLDQEMRSKGWWFRDSLTYEDNVCDYLMRPWGTIDNMLSTIDTVTLPENKDIFHIVEYDDLVSKPAETMQGIYDFIGMKSYDHNYKKIVKAHIDREDLINEPDDMHAVRLNLEKTSLPVEDVLSKYIIDKYSNLDYWRK
jgi:sulfotransferase